MGSIFSVKTRCRTPGQSEIKLDELNKTTYEEIYNLVRVLVDPYPNAYIEIDNRKLLIQLAERHNVVPGKAFVISYNNPVDLESLKNNKDIYLKLKDGYAKLTKFKIK